MIPASGSASSPPVVRGPGGWARGCSTCCWRSASSGSPSRPDISLDDSWQMALGYAAEHGLQHGREIVFTYGPLAT